MKRVWGKKATISKPQMTCEAFLTTAKLLLPYFTSFCTQTEQQFFMCKLSLCIRKPCYSSWLDII